VQQEYISGERFVWLAGAACQIFRLPFDAQLLAREFPPPHERAAVVEAFAALGLRVALNALPLEGLARLTGPAFLVVAGGDDESGAGQLDFVLFLRCDGERISILEPGAQSPVELPLAGFAARYRGEVLQFAPKEEPVADLDGGEAKAA
jgi:subfamily B ATP-binding cassette protein HlyB/CyaB